MKLKAPTQRLTLTEVRDRDLFDELNSLIKDKELFLNKELDTLMLAAVLKVPSHRIPRVVKKFAGVSVPVFISRIRMEYLHQKIIIDAKWRRMTIDEMAFCSGFGSRNAFYTAYRKAFQATPTDYINRLLDEALKATVAV